MGRLIRCITEDDTVRVLIVDVRDIAEEARRAHQLGPTAARMSAEAIAALALMSAWLKGEERLNLQIQASRPRFGFTADLRANGDIRARFTPEEVQSESGAASGILVAIKYEGATELYRGHTAMDDEPVAAALQRHLDQSAQNASVVGLSVRVDESGKINFASGFFVERLPEHPGQPHIEVEAFRERYGALAQQPAAEVLTDMAFGSVAGQRLKVLEAHDLQWSCTCSIPRVEGMLRALGAPSLREMLAEDGQAEVTCHFCNTARVVSGERLAELILELERSGAGEA
jgi:molecular chaperone Hsp33